MGDYRASILNTQANPSPCPYPTTEGNFPMPSTSETNDDNQAHINPAPLGMLSPYYRDRITSLEDVVPTGLPIIGAGSEHIQNDGIPSAPYMDDNLEGEPSNARPTIGFSNPMADQPALNPSDPPPSYDDLFAAPKDEIQPKPITGITPNGQRCASTTARTARRFMKYRKPADSISSTQNDTQVPLLAVFVCAVVGVALFFVILLFCLHVKNKSR